MIKQFPFKKHTAGISRAVCLMLFLLIASPLFAQGFDEDDVNDEAPVPINGYVLPAVLAGAFLGSYFIFRTTRKTVKS